MKRIATALVLIPAVVALVLTAPPWSFNAFAALVGLLAFHEFDNIAAQQGVPRAGWQGMAAGIILLLAPEPFLIIVLLGLVALARAMREDDFVSMLRGASVFLLGVVYIFGAWRCAAGLRAINPHWLMIALLVSWAGDTAALYVGRAFGRHKFAPRISPGKTWEGCVGSVAGGTLGAAIYAHYFIPSAPLAAVIAIAALANIAGQLGDLCESALKRGAGVKDSGSSLPGHGGWLDRIDSTLFSVPVVYAVVKFALAT